MPVVLMEMMRHESIETTLRFYVGRNATDTADVVYDAYLQSQNAKSTRGSEKRDASRDTNSSNGQTLRKQDDGK
jgi:hypothetical protein